MKPESLFALILITGALFFSCKNIETKKKMMPQLVNTDSASVIYYNTPGNPRFFTFTKVMDMKTMSPFFTDVNKKLISAREDCETQGKIYFYGKEGAVYTVYFNDLEDCMTLSFIDTGEKYFTGMSKEAKELLQQWRQLAKEPLSSK